MRKLIIGFIAGLTGSAIAAESLPVTGPPITMTLLAENGHVIADWIRTDLNGIVLAPGTYTLVVYAKEQGK